MAVIQLEIDRFRWNHREALSLQTVGLVPRLPVPLMESIGQLQRLCWAFDRRVMSGFLDPMKNAHFENKVFEMEKNKQFQVNR